MTASQRYHLQLLLLVHLLLCHCRLLLGALAPLWLLCRGSGKQDRGNNGCTEKVRKQEPWVTATSARVQVVVIGPPCLSAYGAVGWTEQSSTEDRSRRFFHLLCVSLANDTGALSAVCVERGKDGQRLDETRATAFTTRVAKRSTTKAAVNDQIGPML